MRTQKKKKPPLKFTESQGTLEKWRNPIFATKIFLTQAKPKTSEPRLESKYFQVRNAFGRVPAIHKGLVHFGALWNIPHTFKDTNVSHLQL